MNILVSGSSGLIGKNFVRQAMREGHWVQSLNRHPESFKMLPADRVFAWSHEIEVPEQALQNVDAVVHLSGENIAEKPWTEEQKKRLVDSRILGTRNLVNSLAKLPAEKRPKVLISGSAIGYYGYKSTEPVDESSRPGEDFLAKLCLDWEQEALQAEKLGIRVVLLRTGIVLSREGGALAKMPPVQISDGKSWMSWIHIQDMVRIILFALKNSSLVGAVNCVSPNPSSNKEFVKALAKVKGVPSVGFVPSTFLSLGLGELSNAILSSLQVQPKVLLKAGFEFLHPNLGAALEDEFKGSQLFDSFLFKDQFVPLKPEQIFQFFVRAENLEALTPPWLNFKIISKSTDEVQKDTLIDYKLKIHGVPVYWKTLISEWKENEYFVDQQLKGPYSKWRHLHTFEAVPGGCLLRDEVVYRVPVAFVGKALLGGWISNDVSQIFKYRQDKIQSLLESGELTKN